MAFFIQGIVKTRDKVRKKADLECGFSKNGRREREREKRREWLERKSRRDDVKDRLIQSEPVQTSD